MKENKRTRNQNEEGMEKCEEKRDEERKKAQREGMWVTQMEERLRMLYKTLLFTSTLLKMKMKTELYICPTCRLVYSNFGLPLMAVMISLILINVPMSKTKNMFLILINV